MKTNPRRHVLIFITMKKIQNPEVSFVNKVGGVLNLKEKKFKTI